MQEFQEQQRRFPCGEDDCPFIAKRNSEVIWHKARVHNMEGLLIECGESYSTSFGDLDCQHASTNRADHRRHVRERHEVWRKKLICSFEIDEDDEPPCGYSSHRLFDFNRHKKNISSKAK